MEFEKLVSPSLKDLFISHIEAMILSGELPVGQQLPPERQLAQSMGVSRAVVNSGIVELERRGFLEIRPRVGTFVTDYRRAGTLETLKSIMTYNRGHLRNEEIRSILEVRDALDKLAVAGIIPHVTEEDIDLLAEKAEAMAELLKEATGLPVVLWDERRTTIDAHQILMTGGKNAKKRKKVVDAVAASLILEGYLTFKKSHL